MVEVRAHDVAKDKKSPNKATGYTNIKTQWNLFIAVYHLLMTNDKLPWYLTHTGHLYMGRTHNIGQSLPCSNVSRINPNKFPKFIIKTLLYNMISKYLQINFSQLIGAKTEVIQDSLVSSFIHLSQVLSLKV